jgi:dihydroorotate dehydrogenase electron transfer subunit
MLKALSAAAFELGIPCEVSLESPMACGIGLCQGCPIEVTDGPKKYALVCKEGTVFDSQRIKFA